MSHDWSRDHSLLLELATVVHQREPKQYRSVEGGEEEGREGEGEGGRRRGRGGGEWGEAEEKEEEGRGESGG